MKLPLILLMTLVMSAASYANDLASYMDSLEPKVATMTPLDDSRSPEYCMPI
ncbi:hypothetical protein HG263_16835 [Pseudoalteromonas sp. JBTF-M23]|uniref:Uncharacterized protein n=1 Tax=Pseudoalteromonas caenipelagi TaxID=2726988 RepID=A0A849VKQ9_9GAMM|nr:hypothetical protein [Pseudoalteromonas caenipelagi]NOU52197.1 hypothetical protein [Pseudoalteromonas caenipelagi]